MGTHYSRVADKSNTGHDNCECPPSSPDLTFSEPAGLLARLAAIFLRAQRQQQTEPAAEHVDADVKESCRIMQYALLAEQLNTLLKEGDAEDQGQNDRRRQRLAASLPCRLCISKAASTAKSRLCMTICIHAGLNSVLKSL